MQQAVSASRPALLGKSVRVRYVARAAATSPDNSGGSGGGFIEADVDCNATPAAGRIVSLVKASCRSLVVDLAFVLEAQTSEELPEAVLGCVRLTRADLSEAVVPQYDADAAADGDGSAVHTPPPLVAE